MAVAEESVSGLMCPNSKYPYAPRSLGRSFAFPSARPLDSAVAVAHFEAERST